MSMSSSKRFCTAVNMHFRMVAHLQETTEMSSGLTQTFLLCAWTNFSWQDEPWTEFSTLEVAACHAMHLPHSIAIWHNLELKSLPKQLLGSLPLNITVLMCVMFLVRWMGVILRKLWLQKLTFSHLSSFFVVATEKLQQFRRGDWENEEYQQSTTPNYNHSMIN